MENEQLIESYCTEILLLKDNEPGKQKKSCKTHLEKIYGEIEDVIFDTAWKDVEQIMEKEKSEGCQKHAKYIEEYQGVEEDRKESVQNKIGTGFNENEYEIAIAKVHRQVISKYRKEIEKSFNSEYSSDDTLQKKIQEQIGDNFDESVFSEALRYLKRLYKNRYGEYIRRLSNNSQKGTNPEEDIKSKVQKKFGKGFREDIFESAKNEIQREKTIEREAAILSRKDQPLNQILFGPPGTGKTYISIEKALDIINPMWKKQSATTDDEKLREHAITLYNKYVESGQIVFTTFHQSMSYEDFIEGIKPSVESTDNTNNKSHTIVGQDAPPTNAMVDGEQGDSNLSAVCEESEESKKANNISYGVQPGIFKEICDKALLDYLCECFCQEKRKEDYRSTDDQLKKHVVLLVQNLMMRENKKQPEEIILQNIEKVLNNIKETGAFEEDTLNKIMITIHSYKSNLQKCCYETACLQNIGDLFFDDYISLIKEEISKNGSYELQSGNEIKIKQYKQSSSFAVTDKIDVPFSAFKKELCSPGNYDNQVYNIWLPRLVDDYRNFVRRKKSPTPYVLIIDEINRGNIASIFGELITLIEDGKRLGRLNALTAKLPYSHEEFGVPDNLYIIGTMNTADRSVEALDSALRRRFVFEEMMPDSKCVPDWEENVGDENNKTTIKLRDIFDTINARLRVLKDRDHQIGHSYFMNIKDDENKWEKLKDVFYRQIIPLLQEFFFNRYDLIAKVLGNGFVGQDPNSKLSMAVYDDSDDDDFTDKRTWRIVPEDDFYNETGFKKGTFIEAITRLLGRDIYNQYKELQKERKDNTND